MVIRSETVLNSLVCPVPYTLCDLSVAEHEAIKRDGVYTQLVAEMVLPHLRPRAVLRGLYGFQHEFGASLMAAAQLEGCPVRDLSFRAIVRVLLGHSAVTWGGSPTRMTWNPVLRHCGTQSKVDTRRIIANGWATAPPECPSPTVQVAYGDGQTNHRIRDEKKDNPVMNQGVICAVAPFHPHGHFMFCIITGFWWVIVCFFCNKLGLQKARARCAAPRAPSATQVECHGWMTDSWYAVRLAGDERHERLREGQLPARLHRNCVLLRMMRCLASRLPLFVTRTYRVCLTQRVITTGIYCYIVLDVKHPPPEVFLQNAKAYMSRVNHASGIVLLTFLLYGGIPSVQWQRAAREGKGEQHETLHAHMVHCCRCFAFKPNCVVTSMLALVSYFCVHPKLRDVVHAFEAISLLGQHGMAIDRLLEYVNLLMQLRMSAFVAFDTQLHSTDLLQPLLHVDHAYWQATHGSTPCDSGVTASMLLQIRAVQDCCLQTLGTDLTVQSDLNHFWYTGVPTSVSGGDYRKKQPARWYEACAQGMSRGAGRGESAPQSWTDYVQDFFAHHCFSR